MTSRALRVVASPALDVLTVWARVRGCLAVPWGVQGPWRVSLLEQGLVAVGHRSTERWAVEAGVALLWACCLEAELDDVARLVLETDWDDGVEVDERPESGGHPVGEWLARHAAGDSRWECEAAEWLRGSVR